LYKRLDPFYALSKPKTLKAREVDEKYILDAETGKERTLLDGYPKLPKDPDDLVEKYGYNETSHPDAVAKGHRRFKNSSTGDTLEFDKGKKGESGHKGRDHYHRLNPNKTGKRDAFLDKNGKPVPKGSKASHLYAGDN